MSTLVVTFLEESNPELILRTIFQDYSDLGRGWNHDWIKNNTAVSKFFRHSKKTKKEKGDERPITSEE